MEEPKIDAAVVAQRGIQLGASGEYRLVIGEKTEGLKDSDKDVAIPNGTFKGLEAFYKSRKSYIAMRKDESMLLLDATNTMATLIIGDAGPRKLVGEDDVTPRYTIKASTQRSRDFRDVLDYMEDTHDSAQDLAMELRKRPELFESLSEMARVVNYLRTTSLKVKSVREEKFEDDGQREKRYRAELESPQMNLSWNWHVPLFDGEERVNIPVKAVWEVQSNMAVRLVLLDQGTVVQERTAKEELMAGVAEGFVNVIGADVVPIIYVNGNQSSIE